MQVQLADFDCPNCDCKRTVCFYYGEQTLKDMVAAWNENFKKKQAAAAMSGKTIRRSGYPEQLFACLC